MRTITISGSTRNIGKTTLARALKNVLNDNIVVIKIGHGEDKNKPEKLFHSLDDALEFVDTLKKEAKTEFCIIESNQILNKIKPDLAIFIEKKESEKLSSAQAKKLAHIVINQNLDLASLQKTLAATKIFSKKIQILIAKAIEDFYFDYLIQALSIKTKVWFEHDSKMVFGPGKYILLKKIEELSSLNKAAKELKMSYRHAWAYIQTMEKRLNQEIITLKTPGVKNAGSKLTDFAKKLMNRYELLLANYE
jgi:molybdate transport system regulatory protein